MSDHESHEGRGPYSPDELADVRERMKAGATDYLSPTDEAVVRLLATLDVLAAANAQMRRELRNIAEGKAWNARESARYALKLADHVEAYR